MLTLGRSFLDGRAYMLTSSCLFAYIGRSHRALLLPPPHPSVSSVAFLFSHSASHPFISSSHSPPRILLPDTLLRMVLKTVPLSRFWSDLATILPEIAKSEYVAIDFEMTGIEPRRAPKLHQPTMNELYQRAKQTTETFSVVQFGITCVTFDETDKCALVLGREDDERQRKREIRRQLTIKQTRFASSRTTSTSRRCSTPATVAWTSSRARWTVR